VNVDRAGVDRSKEPTLQRNSNHRPDPSSTRDPSWLWCVPAVLAALFGTSCASEALDDAAAPAEAVGTTELAATTVNVSGRILYTRNWADQSFNQTGSLTPPSGNTGVKPAVDVTVTVQCVSPRVCSPNLVENIHTDANGNFTVPFQSMTGGTSVSVSVQFNGKNLDNPSSTVGYRLVASNTAGTLPKSPEQKLSASLGRFNLPVSGGSIGTYTEPANTVNNRRFNAFDAMRFGVSRWRALGFADIDSLVPGLHFERAVTKLRGWTDADPNSSCGVTAGTDPCFNFDTDPVDQATAWHEMSHGLLAALMADFNGQSAWVFNGFSTPCAPPSAGQTQGDPGSAQISEAWANFSALNISYGVANYPSNLQPWTGIVGFPNDALNNNCSTCEYSPAAAKPNPPACGAGSILRTEPRALKVLIDLVDTVQSGPNCSTEDVSIPVSHVLAAIAKAPLGTGQGQLSEQLSSPAFGNATIQEDASGMLDILRAVDRMEGLADSRTQKIWRNACWIPGNTDTGYNPGL
jgi:hypothetical protein